MLRPRFLMTEVTDHGCFLGTNLSFSNYTGGSLQCQEVCYISYQKHIQLHLHRACQGSEKNGFVPLRLMKEFLGHLGGSEGVAHFLYTDDFNPSLTEPINQNILLTSYLLPQGSKGSVRTVPHRCVPGQEGTEPVHPLLSSSQFLLKILSHPELS